MSPRANVSNENRQAENRQAENRQAENRQAVKPVGRRVCLATIALVLCRPIGSKGAAKASDETK
jgi:hypothetical protein